MPASLGALACFRAFGYGLHMALIRWQVIIQPASGVPDEVSVNTWHFDDNETQTSYPLIQTALQNLYNNVRPYFSTLVSQSGHQHKAYKVSDPEPRRPIYEAVWNLTNAPTQDPLPPEVACTLSFQADPISGQSQARRRGRVYLGPLGTNTIASDGRFANLFVEAMETVGNSLLSASNSSPGWKWAVYSTVNQTASDVASGWVDNEPDTQRRRGRPATNRQTFP